MSRAVLRMAIVSIVLLAALGLAAAGAPPVAAQGDASSEPFAYDAESLDFSYSGLKTTVLYHVRGRPEGRGRQPCAEGGDDRGPGRARVRWLDGNVIARQQLRLSTVRMARAPHA